MRRTTTLLTLAACLALAGCSDSDEEPTAEATETATATATPTPSSSSLSQAEAASQCTDAIAEAAPGWEDWNYNPGEWQDDPRTPEVCQGLADEENPPRGNRAFMDALVAGLEMADDPRARQ
ncbi:hypothetical protein [Streptomyces sp. NPDC003730]